MQIGTSELKFGDGGKRLVAEHRCDHLTGSSRSQLTQLPPKSQPETDLDSSAFY